MTIKIKVKKEHALLTEACKNNNLDAVKKLIEDGVDLTETWSSKGCYPLMGAIQNNNVEMVRLLAENGMPLYFNNKSSNENFDSEDEIKQNVVFFEWDKDYADALLAVLDYVEPGSFKEGISLVLSSMAGLKDEDTSDKSDQFLEKLLTKGADVDCRISFGGTTLHLIAIGRNTKYTDKLIRLSKDIDAADNDGYHATALYGAFYRCLPSPIKALLEMGANPNACCLTSKESVLDRAFYFKKRNKRENRDGKVDKIIDLLRSYGAKTYEEMVQDGDIKE
ncbi:ankyrin repeat domain-containing protein [Litoribacillus peritrichatus]|uniref:Ankyrin repeat domain-containing protein n=1 Tax=Litoribacillus peritrichatus TaxID=718191 RepID=A0ABP7MFP8_9GAMM